MAIQIHSPKGLCPIAFILKRCCTYVNCTIFLLKNPSMLQMYAMMVSYTCYTPSTILWQPWNHSTVWSVKHGKSSLQWTDFTMSQRSDRQDLSTHKIMICQCNNRQVCWSVTQTFDNLHGAPVRLLGHIMKKKTKIEKSTMYSAMHKKRYNRKFMF